MITAKYYLQIRNLYILNLKLSNTYDAKKYDKFCLDIENIKT